MEQLKNIQLYRDQNKADILSKVSLICDVKDQQTINVISGEPSLIEIDVSNPFAVEHTFHIEVFDDDYNEGFIGKHELMLVGGDGSGGGEWRKWYELGKCSLPLDMSNLDHLKNEITLKKNHKQKLLFKFLSYREPALKNEKDDGLE